MEVDHTQRGDWPKNVHDVRENQEATYGSELAVTRLLQNVSNIYAYVLIESSTIIK